MKLYQLIIFCIGVCFSLQSFSSQEEKVNCLDYILAVAPYLEAPNYDIQCLENNMVEKKVEICSDFSFTSNPSDKLVEYSSLLEEEAAIQQELRDAEKPVQKARVLQKLERLRQKQLLSDADDVVASQISEMKFNNGSSCDQAK